MKKTLLIATMLTTLCCIGPCYIGQGFAATPATPAAAPASSSSSTATPASTTSSATLSPQNNRMKSCAAQYHQQNIPKSQYHSFMSTCLKNPATAASTATTTAKPITPTAGPAPAANAPSTATPPGAKP